MTGCPHCGVDLGWATPLHEPHCELRPQPVEVVALHDNDLAQKDQCQCPTCKKVREWNS